MTNRESWRLARRPNATESTRSMGLPRSRT